MSRNTKACLQSLNSRLMTLSSYSSKISFPGSEFAPPQNSVWLKVDYLFAPPKLMGAFSDSGMYREQGVYQVTVYGPKGKGSFEVIDAVDAVLDLFQRGTELTGFGPTVKIERSYRSSPMEESPWTKVPVNIEFWWYAPYRS